MTEGRPEAGELLDAPAEEPIPEREVSLSRRLLNWKTIASIVFAVALLALAFRTLGANLADTWSLITQADPALLLVAFLAYYATFPVRSYRWRYVLSKVGTKVGFRDATEILFLSWFVNCVVPAKLGDLYRAYLLKGTQGASASRTVGTIFVERIADIIVMFALALAAGYWSFRGRLRPEVELVFLIGLGIAVLLVVMLVVLRFWGGGLTRRLPHRVADLYERFHEGSTGALTFRTMPVLLVTTGVIWLLEGMRLYFVIRALGLPEVGLGISSSVFVALAAALLTAIPLTPAGAGFVEAGIAGALFFYGVSGDPALAVALTDRGISILTVIVLGGAFYLVSGKVRKAHGASLATS
ncbi:MAG TPA: lysylphosphatidylglycerol synthase transmembrane domain-containing protein [candidate division Zixibacteria bacterium]|nr:lysylphosphatidylglycerol synthase transmembrane domain-containing protein [candidate division Zixibacteria bacterium]